ncbi:hypothetical protein [Fundidesulfovibrio putealis]|uniref:hypothetical protein n=1 Tax=Fundidesulfovibrio putealis TaxID=270496 RepID=UPI0004876298|nr:hypothetical protein [Fundidesulfovibrio putealis]
MNEQTRSTHEAVNAADPGMDGGTHRPRDEFQACSGPFARVAPLIMSQPGALDLSEMLLRLRRREL